MGDTGSKGSIKIQVLNSFSEKINTINTELTNLEAAITAADNAVERAIQATGGEATKVGHAIVVNCQQANDGEFTNTKNSLDAFLTGTKHISASYIAEQAEILKALNSINEEAEKNGGPRMEIA